MAVPTIPLDASLADVLQENSFTLGKLQTHPLAVPFTMVAAGPIWARVQVRR